MVVALLVTGTASANHTDGNPATATFNPLQLIGTSYPYYGYNSSLIFDVTQQDHEVPIKSYRVDIPAGWNIAMNSVDPPTTYTNCFAPTDNDMPMNIGVASPGALERVGSVLMTLLNDPTRGQGGPVPYSGFLWFLKFDETTQTTTLCGRITTSNGALFTHSQIRFEVLLKHNGDGSFTMTWDFSAVDGAPAGDKSIFDNADFQNTKASVLYTRLELNTLTSGNFNKDPSGAKAKVRFVWNPQTTGSYTFTGTYTPCSVAAGDPASCASNFAPAVRNTTIRITNYPTGYHPGATITSPALWSVLRGNTPLTVKWKPPTSTSAADQVKGYVLTMSADYVANSTKTEYMITNPSVAGYDAAKDPCATTEAGTTCTWTKPWPLVADGGLSLPVDANFSLNIVTLYVDGHRSDGNCDDATPAGFAPPCAGDTVPAVPLTGVARTQFLHRAYQWPLAYQKIVSQSCTRNFSNGKCQFTGVWQVYVLLADLDARQFQYIEWKPVGLSFTGGGLTVVGSNALGGVISYTNLTGPYHWTLNAVLGPSDARGAWLRMSSTNEIQNADRFDGCTFFDLYPTTPSLGLHYPCPAQAAAMGKI
jgi:hypothetical protein